MPASSALARMRPVYVLAYETVNIPSHTAITYSPSAWSSARPRIATSTQPPEPVEVPNPRDRTRETPRTVPPGHRRCCPKQGTEQEQHPHPHPRWPDPEDPEQHPHLHPRWPDPEDPEQHPHPHPRWPSPPAEPFPHGWLLSLATAARGGPRPSHRAIPPRLLLAGPPEAGPYPPTRSVCPDTKATPPVCGPCMRQRVGV